MSTPVFLVAPTLSLLLGQLGAERWKIAAVLWSALLLFAIIALLRCRRDWGIGVLIALCCAAYLWGYLTYARLLHPEPPEHHIARLANMPQPMWVEGRLYREPEQRQDRTRLFLRIEGREKGETGVAATGNVAVTIGRAYREWHYGDRVRLPLRLRVPRSRTSFDYAAYLARREIYRIAYLHNDWQVRLLSRDTRSVWASIERMRRGVRRFIYRHLSSPAAPLLETLVLGDRGALPPGLVANFATVGMAHVLSISGLHVGMLSLCAFTILRYLLSRRSSLLLRWPVYKLASLLSTVPVFLYAALAGGRIPTVRAAIMIGVYQLAVLVDREEETLTSLSLAALIVGIVWPGAVMETSFQLSFLAVLAIVWGLRIVRSRRATVVLVEPTLRSAWGRGRARVLIGVLVPILATVGTGPLIVYHFGSLSLSGLVANPLLVPVVGFVLVPLGLVTGVMSLVWSPVAVWLARGIEPLLSLLSSVVGMFAALPMSAVQLPRPEPWVIAVIYALLLGLAGYASSRAR